MDENNKALGPPEEQGASGFSIAGFVRSILGCTAIIGLIFALIDLFSKDGRKKGLSKAAVGICIGWAAIGMIYLIGREKVDKKDN